jgi:hypothetical protein
MSANRRARRETAKKMGYLGKPLSYQELANRLDRSQEAGNMIHRQHIEQQRWDMKKKEEIAKNEKIMNDIQSKYTEDFTLDPSAFNFLNTANTEELGDLPS